MMKIHLKLKALDWSQHISHYKSMGIFSDAQGQVPDRILPNFEPVREIMGVLVACKNEEDPIKNEGARGVTTLFIDFFRRSMAANSKVRDGILPKFKPNQAFMTYLVTCKNEEDPLENEGTRVVTTFLPLYVYGDVSKRSRAANS